MGKHTVPQHSPVEKKKRISSEMSEARLRLTTGHTGQTMMAASPPPNSRESQMGFRENLKTVSPFTLCPHWGPISVIWAQSQFRGPAPGLGLLPGFYPRLLGGQTQQWLSLGPGGSGPRSQADCFKGYLWTPSYIVGLC